MNALAAPRRWTGAGLLVSQTLIWGLTYVAIDVALASFEPGLLAFARAALGCAVLLACVPRLTRPMLKLIRKRPLQLLLFGTLNLALPFYLIAVGQQTVAPGATAVLLATSPAFVALAAGWTGDANERLTVRAWVGVGIATAGVAVVVGADAGQVSSAWGAAAILLAAAAYAAGALLAKAIPLGSSLEQAAATLFSGCVPLAFVAVAALPDEPPSVDASFALIALALFGTALSFVLLFASVRYGGAGFSLRPIYLSPAVSIAASAVLLGDVVTGGLAVGTVLALAGVLLIGGSGAPAEADQ